MRTLSLLATVSNRRVSYKTILGQQVMVENRPGGSGRVAGLAAAKAIPEGYTFIMMGSGECCVIRHLFQLPYDIEQDFVPISLIEVLPAALVVRESLPVKSLSELAAYGKQHPGELTYGLTGAGLFLHLNGIQFGNAAHLDLRHVPYGQGSPFTDLLGGHIDMTTTVPARCAIRAKRAHVRPLLVEHGRVVRLICVCECEEHALTKPRHDRLVHSHAGSPGIGGERAP